MGRGVPAAAQNSPDIRLQTCGVGNESAPAESGPLLSLGSSLDLPALSTSLQVLLGSILSPMVFNVYIEVAGRGQQEV